MLAGVLSPPFYSSQVPSICDGITYVQNVCCVVHLSIRLCPLPCLVNPLWKHALTSTAVGALALY